MQFVDCFAGNSPILMEGALGERLKREYNIKLHQQLDLAPILYSNSGKEALKNIWSDYILIAQKYNLPFMATTPTRRVNIERIEKSNFDEKIIYDNVNYLKEIRTLSEKDFFVGGLIGCKGDAYLGTEVLSIEDSYRFHSWSVNHFNTARVDFLFAAIMPALSEIIGMAKAIEETDLPYIISFMLKKDGRLIDGISISEAIETIDKRTNRKPVCYMTNCIHPTVLYKALEKPFNKTAIVKARFKGIQANTSALSPEELDGSCELITFDGVSLANDIAKLKDIIDVKIAGGCCGTDGSHIEGIAKVLACLE